ncbi:MAG: TonB-dependent receptor [Niabella sp.]
MRVAFSILFLLSPAFLLHAQVSSPVSDTLRRDSVMIELKQELQDNLPTLTIGDDEFDEAGGGGVSSILTAGRDPFLSAAEFNFSPVRFRLRGYETLGNAIYLNGINFSGLDNGFTPFGIWGGLNNVMRSRQTSYGLASNDFAIGTLALNTNIDMRAGSQWQQTQVGYALSNRNYRHRVTFSHGSGFDKKGWAYSLAFSGRYADEGYVPGTYYRGFSYYAAVDKKIGVRNTLSLIAFGAPTDAGRQGGSVQEAMDLVGSNFYNPSWGWQEGKKRNSNVLETFQPAFMAQYERKPNNHSSWSTTMAYVFGKRKTSAFDWYNAPDPRPDYYRYLPSYYSVSNPNLEERLRNGILSNHNLLQVNWDKLYDANRNNLVTIQNVDGIAGNNVSGHRSTTILSNRVNDLRRLMANTVYNTRIDNLSLTAGANFQQQVNQYYLEVKDLLGGDFWVNVNQFAERDYPNDPDILQYDLDKPNQLKKAGDRYGYNYKMTMTRAAVWGQALLNLDYFDMFAAAEISTSSFYRTGINRNGLFPNQSKGKAESQNFLNTTLKAGITYKMNGRNYFFANGAYLTNPPFFENVYISPRTRNDIQPDLKSEKVLSAEAGYKFVSPKVKAGLTGFYTQSKDGYDMMTFYADQYQAFGNYALSGIDKLFFGGELGLDIKLTQTLSFNGAASVGRYYYDSRQKAVITVDNSAQELGTQTAYLKNYRLPSTPQNAYSAGFFYRSPKYWYVSLTGNYFGNMWLSPNPIRRTAEAIGDVNPEDPALSEAARKILAQEKFDDQFTLDFFGGWSKRLPKQYNIHNKPTYLVFNLGVNNILDNREIRSGGYEQLRFDFEGKRVDKFPPKYYYAYGLNYFASITLRFN